MHYMQINRGHNRILYSWKVSTVKTGPQDIKAICTQIQNYDTSTEILKLTSIIKHFLNNQKTKSILKVLYSNVSLSGAFYK